MGKRNKAAPKVKHQVLPERKTHQLHISTNNKKVSRGHNKKNMTRRFARAGLYFFCYGGMPGFRGDGRARGVRNQSAAPPPKRGGKLCVSTNNRRRQMSAINQ